MVDVILEISPNSEKGDKRKTVSGKSQKNKLKAKKTKQKEYYDDHIFFFRSEDKLKE